MKTKITYILFILLFITLSCSNDKDNDISPRVKISLREVGNQLLLTNKDKTSLVLPIETIAQSKYLLSFETDLKIIPDSLVTVIASNFEKAKLSQDYRVEVLQCDEDKVAYSYQVFKDEEQTIIPCSSRALPKACYYIEVKFLDNISSNTNSIILLYIFGFITIVFVFYAIFRNKKSNFQNPKEAYTQIGHYKFYEVQNVLVKEAEEIPLSKKECELLSIFVSRPNEVITRDELTKKVWEDNGVVVGRSLDTFISKLRKKLYDDTSVKITNIHGVGYKLEMV